ncbi:VTT domain-containing protein [Thermoleophilia bacterium SCSIO 60948]|nr:VTT domain-containing protein [Thermoleophilia bacterium SCSIO 60948]
MTASVKRPEAEPAPSPADERSTRLLRYGLPVALILACVGAALAIPPLREAVVNALQGDTEAVREELLALGAGGYAILFGLTIVHTVVWYPTEIVNTAAGFVYGFWPALIVCLTGWTVSGVLGWTIGRMAGPPLLHRVIGAERFERAEAMAERGGITLLLAMRLVPIVPFSLFSVAAGAARVPLGRFTWTSAVGYFPITALFVFFGSRLDELSLSDPALWIGVGVLIALLLSMKYLKPKPKPKPASDSEIEIPKG